MGNYLSKRPVASHHVGVGDRIRTMGSHEGYQVAMHTLDQYRGTVIGCVYRPSRSLANPSALTSLKSHLVNALARVVLNHPHLHVGIVDDDTKNPQFVRLDQIDLRHHVEWRACEDAGQLEHVYLSTLQQQLDLRFENLSTQPGWRLIILHSPSLDVLYILYVWNHPHHDGMGGKIFHRHFLRALNENNSTASENHTIDIARDTWILRFPNDVDKLPPNAERICSWPLDIVFTAKWLYNEFKPVSFFHPCPHAKWAPIKCTPYATRYRTITLETSVVSNVVLVCRMHDTTLTGLLHALVLASLSCSLDHAPGTGFASRTPYDLRHFLPARTREYPWLEPKETICNYDSVLDHEYAPSVVEAIRDQLGAASAGANASRHLPSGVLQTIWTEAARVRSAIASKLALGTRNDLLAVMGLCPNWLTQQQREAQRTRYLSWLVTNLGVIDGRGEGAEGEGWALQKAELVLSAEVPSAALSISVMTVQDGPMCVTCSWQDGVVEDRVGERLSGDLDVWLRDIGRAQDIPDPV